MRYLLATFLCITTWLTGTSQLGGTYTIGGTNPDFPDFVSAIQALDQQNTSDTTMFLIRAGTYMGSIDLWFSTDHPVTFRSESGVNDVTISSNDYTTIELEWPTSQPVMPYRFKHLTFTSAATGNPAYTYALDLAGFWAIIDSCVFNSGLKLENMNTLLNTHPCILSNSIVNCPNEVEFYGGEVHHCTFNSDGFEQRGGGGDISFHHNTLTGLFDGVAGDIYENVMHDLRFSHFGKINVVKNTLYGGLQFSFNYSEANVVGNKVFGGTSFSHCDQSYVANNYFYNVVDYGLSSGALIINNNFSPSAYLLMGNSNGIIKNNLFSLGVYGNVYGCTIENNNYYLTQNPSGYSVFGGQFDANPYSYDPMYPDTVNLYPENPALLGRGHFVTPLTHDIDSITRDIPPALGAHEICFGAMGRDTLTMACGDSIPLTICEIPDSGNYNWTPATGLSDSTVRRPFASPGVTTSYSVIDSVSGFYDTIIVHVVPFEVRPERDTTLGCGDSMTLLANYHPYATYDWTPGDGLQDSTARFTLAHPPVTQVYSLEVTIPGCGTYEDSIKVFVDSLPQADGYAYTDQYQTLIYGDQSLCADSVIWFFGDGDTSHVGTGTHVYDTSGVYTVCLVAYNSYGTDTICGNYAIYDSIFPGVKEETESFIRITLFPNPNTGEFKIRFEQGCDERVEYAVYDMYGRLHYRNFVLSPSDRQTINVDLGDCASGQYIVVFYDESGERVKRSRIIVE